MLLHSTNLHFGAKAMTPDLKEQLIQAMAKNKAFLLRVDAQEDFFRFSKGSLADPPDQRVGLPVPEAGEKSGKGIRPNVAQLTWKLVDVLGLLQVATRDTMDPNDKEFEFFTATSRQHCVKGTPGWQLIPEVMPERGPTQRVVTSQKRKDVPALQRLKKLATLLFDKTAFNIGEFRPNPNSMETQTDPKAKLLFDRLKALGKQFVIIDNVATDYCVEGATAFSSNWFTPILVADALKAVDPAKNAYLSTDPNGLYADHLVYKDITVINTKDLLDCADEAQQRRYGKRGPKKS